MNFHGLICVEYVFAVGNSFRCWDNHSNSVPRTKMMWHSIPGGEFTHCNSLDISLSLDIRTSATAPGPMRKSSHHRATHFIFFFFLYSIYNSIPNVWDAQHIVWKVEGQVLLIVCNYFSFIFLLFVWVVNEWEKCRIGSRAGETEREEDVCILFQTKFSREGLSQLGSYARPIKYVYQVNK